MQPLVSIGLPFYNNRETLILAVQSIFAQTYQNWELLLIDDGSSDEGHLLVASLKDSRVKLMRDGQNKGLIARLNQLAQIAGGEFLARMDADDLMDPLRIEKQMNVLINNPSIDLVDAGTYSIDENGTPQGKRGLGEINYNPKHVLKNAMLLHASVIGKRTWFLQNPYDKDYTRAEDYELWCRTFRHSKFARVQEPLYIVREGRVNISNYAKSSNTIRKIFKKYGPAILSSSELRAEIFKSHLKVLAYRLFAFFNQHNYLSRKRNIPLREDEKEKVRSIMKQIATTNIA